jgi:hypothetical protein
MYYVIVTTSINNSDTRTQQYINGITALLKYIPKENIIIVENNGQRATFLDSFGVKVVYTNNNTLYHNNYGSRELSDILECISKCNIADNDFIVKLTGRYIIQENSLFINELLKLTDHTDCIVRFGSYLHEPPGKCKDCVTGLIGLRCKFMKMIKKQDIPIPMEYQWGNVIYTIPDDCIISLQRLGILACPGGSHYRLL